MMSTTLAALAAATMLTTATLLAACGGGGGTTEPNNQPGPGGGPQPGPAPTSAVVAMQSSSDGYGGTENTFSPTSVRVARNGTVTWRNNTDVSHNVTFGAVAGAPENIPNHTAGDNPRTFGTAGSFSYQCTNHPGMNGVVAVE
jgi:plastocyanin